MSHASDEDLVLLAYGESTPADRHLSACLRCRGRMAKMREFLVGLEEIPVPERAADYGGEVWRRLAPRLAQEPVPMAGRLLLRRNLLRAAAVAALLAAAFFLGRSSSPPSGSLTAGARERILLEAVGEHLERSQSVLLDFVNADPAAEIAERDRQRAGELLSDGRLYRETASRAGDAALASVLDDLERVLLEVAHGAATPAERAALRHRIDADEMLFKVRILDARVRARVAAPPIAGRAL